MRSSWIAITAGLVACGKAEPPPAPTSAPTEQRVAPKQPVPSAPLPPLAKDPGGATGAPAWATGFGGLGIDTPRDLAVGPGGEAYVVGYFDGEAKFGRAGTARAAGDPAAKKPTSDGYLLALDAKGAPAWVRTFGGPRDDVANGVAVRGEQIAVVGAFLDELKLGELVHKATGSDDMFVAVFDRRGEPLWLWHGGSIDSDGANAVAATPDGGWLVGGSFSNTATFTAHTLISKGGTDAVLLKFAASGDLEWLKQFGGRYNDTIKALAVDAQGGIYVQGQFRDVAAWGGAPLTAGGGADNDIVLAKYDLNGDHVWSQRFGSPFDEAAGGVCVDPAGNVAMTGSFDRTISFGAGDEHTAIGESDAFVARYTGAGALQWAKTYGSEREDAGQGLACDAAGNSIATGWFQNQVDFGDGARSSKGNKDVFAVKLDPRGELMWARTFGDKDHDQGRAVARGSDGAVYLAGIFRFGLRVVEPALESVRAEGDRIPKPDTFVLKLDR